MPEPTPPKGTIELYEKAVKLHKEAYKKPQWDKEKYKASVGHKIKALFGKECWTLKDLNDEQLTYLIEKSERRLEVRELIKDKPWYGKKAD